MSSLISWRPAGAEFSLSLRGKLALAAGKSAARASRLIGRGGGTAITGMVARKVDPSILDELVRVPGVPVVAISGSNGKTTPLDSPLHYSAGRGSRFATTPPARTSSRA